MTNIVSEKIMPAGFAAQYETKSNVSGRAANFCVWLAGPLAVPNDVRWENWHVVTPPSFPAILPSFVLQLVLHVSAF